MYTHLREEDGEEHGERTASSVSVAESSDLRGAPFLVFSDPLEYAASAAPGSQEHAQFVSVSSVGTGLRIQRPGFLPRGRIVESPSDELRNQTLLRAGLLDGVELVILHEERRAAMEAAQRIADDFRRNGEPADG